MKKSIATYKILRHSPQQSIKRSSELVYRVKQCILKITDEIDSNSTLQIGVVCHDPKQAIITLNTTYF